MATVPFVSPTDSITAKIGGKEVSLRYSTKAVRQLEAKYDRSMLSLLSDFTAGGIRVGVLGDLIIAGSQGEFSEADIDELDIGELYALIKPVAAAVMRSMPAADPKNAPATGKQVELIG